MSLLLDAPGGDRTQRCATEESYLHVFGEAMDAEEPPPAFEAVKWRVPFDGLVDAGAVRTMSASSWRPTSRFQPGMAAMYACTGASPSPFAI